MLGGGIDGLMTCARSQISAHLALRLRRSPPSQWRQDRMLILPGRPERISEAQQAQHFDASRPRITAAASIHMIVGV